MSSTDSESIHIINKEAPKFAYSRFGGFFHTTTGLSILRKQPRKNEKNVKKGVDEVKRRCYTKTRFERERFFYENKNSEKKEFERKNKKIKKVVDKPKSLW